MNDLETIRIYGNPVLRKPTDKITVFDGELRQLAERIIETMFGQGSGIGLSGPQIGVSRKIVVIDVSFGEEFNKILTMINPEIVESEGECTLEEGCLSIPDIYETVLRPSKIFIRFQDLDGRIQEIDSDDFLARVMQHEVDHLNGILFVDRLGTVKRKLISKKLRSLAKSGDTV